MPFCYQALLNLTWSQMLFDRDKKRISEVSFAKNQTLRIKRFHKMFTFGFKLGGNETKSEKYHDGFYFLMIVER
jgi:hypothetical protein